MVDVESMVDQTPEEFLGEEFDVHEAMRFLTDIGIVFDYADDYGEPGYSLDDPEGFFVIGDWWCMDKDCDYPDRYPDDEYNAGEVKIHDVSLHYRRLFERLFEVGMETDFYDEWDIVHGVQVGEFPNIKMMSLAYRSKPDSYSWVPSTMYHDGELLTPHDGIEHWIEACLERGIGLSGGGWTEADLEAQGFIEYNCDYENGWFDGMDDDADKIMKALVEQMGETHDILPFLKENSQFYFKFCVFVREKETDDED